MPECADATNGTCAAGVTWAKDHYKQYPNWYGNVTGKENFTDADWQCFLYDCKGSDKDCEGHNCPLPCTSSDLFPACKSAAGTQTGTQTESPSTGSNSTVPVTPTESGGSSSFPIWAVVLVVIALLAIVGAVVYFLMQKKKKSKLDKKASNWSAFAGTKGSKKKTKYEELPQEAGSGMVTKPDSPATAGGFEVVQPTGGYAMPAGGYAMSAVITSGTGYALPAGGYAMPAAIPSGTGYAIASMQQAAPGAYAMAGAPAAGGYAMPVASGYNLPTAPTTAGGYALP